MIKKIWNKFKAFHQKLGPALITLEGDNDVGAVTTYVQGGAKYGLGLFPLLLLLLPVTFYCQEACARIAIVTQKGPITLIKERFGKVWAKIAVYNLYIINFLTLITEFAMINLLAQSFHLNPYLVVPASIIGLCLVVAPFKYNKWERILVSLCMFDITWLILCMFMPYHGFHPNFSFGFGQQNYLMDIMAVVGTTIAPWQLVFQHSCILDRNMKIDDLKQEKKETLLGSTFTIIVASCMMMIGGIAFFNHINFVDVPTYVHQIQTYMGPFFGNILFLMVLNACIIGTAAVNLSTAWVYAEDKGWPRSLNNKFSEAKGFYFQYFGSIVAAGLITLYPYLPLEKIILGVQVMACLLLPYQLILNQIICNDASIMGQFKNKWHTNLIMNTIIGLIVILSVFLFKQGIGM